MGTITLDVIWFGVVVGVAVGFVGSTAVLVWGMHVLTKDGWRNVKHVYVVVTGAYENEGCSAIFSTEEAARAYAATKPEQDDYEGYAKVQRWELNNTASDWLDLK